MLGSVVQEITSWTMTDRLFVIGRRDTSTSYCEVVGVTLGYTTVVITVYKTRTTRGTVSVVAVRLKSGVITHVASRVALGRSVGRLIGELVLPLLCWNISAEYAQLFKSLSVVRLRVGRHASAAERMVAHTFHLVGIYKTVARVVFAFHALWKSGKNLEDSESTPSFKYLASSSLLPP
jgi:hypothetical protein